MNRNTFKATETESQAQELQEIQGKGTANDSERPQTGFLAKWMSTIFSGTFLENERSLKHLPFILFLFILGLLYIASGYYADDKIREYNRLNRELNELRTSYINAKSELMFLSKQSEMARQVEEFGLKTTVRPPYKTEVDTHQLTPVSYRE